jgi:uncharacterized protein (UPF0548 family)
MTVELDRAVAAEPTYAGTVDGDCPPGFHRLHRQAWVGRGADDFARAAGIVLSWQVLRRAGLRVEANTERPELGATVLQRLGPVRAPCRIIARYDEPGRAGFSYATLPGHAERGVERFLVEQRDDGSVWCVIDSISRGASWYARLGGPVTRLVQARMVGRYLRAVAA